MAEQPGALAGGPLTGIRVVDLSAVVSGPFGTSILADQGADVIVVEQAHAPDIIRQSGPLVESAQGVSSCWASMNRNKRSITLNLKDPRGTELVLALISDADVVVQNFRPGAMERLGLGWEVLHALNPDLVMCSISGRSRRAATDGNHRLRQGDLVERRPIGVRCFGRPVLGSWWTTHRDRHAGREHPFPVAGGYVEPHVHGSRERHTGLVHDLQTVSHHRWLGNDLPPRYRRTVASVV